MRTNSLRLAFLAVVGSVAVRASAQRTGPCPAATAGSLAGSTTGGSVTQSQSTLQRTLPAPEPIECLFSPDGQVRAALYPSSPYEPRPQVRVFRPGAEYGSSWGEQFAERIPVSRGNRFSDLDRTTLERVAAAAGIRGRESVAGTADGSASESASEPAPDPATLRLASYNPTTPSTQSSTTNLRVTSRTYDNLDRLSSETVQLQDGSTATLAYTYWNNGQRKTVTDAVGRVTFYEYDGRNRLSRLTANRGLPDEQVTSYDYWPDSLLKMVTKLDGTVTSYDYDKADRLRNVVVRKDGTNLVSYAYTYDGNGNRLRQVEVNGGPPETTTYTYDDLNRLETVTYPDGRSVAYGYDNVGNRRAETERDPAGVVVSQKVAVFDAANRLSTVTDAVNPANDATFAYDRNGNLTTKTTAAGTASYAYDLRDQLVETREGEHISARFAYDAFGRRYLKIGNEGIRQYLYDQTSLLEEFTETNVEVAKYEWGGDRLVRLFRFNEPRRYFHFDALGSVAALTDDAGSVAARYHYDVWGRHRDPTELEASANRFGFTGHYFDTETNLYYAKARYFDPQLGRFLTQDSFLGQIDNPPSLHRYVYGLNRPTFFVDPDGREVKLAGYTFDEKGNPVPQLTDDTTVFANPTIPQIEEQLRKGEIDQAQALGLATGTRLIGLLGAPKRDFEKSYLRNYAETAAFMAAETVTSPAATTFEGLANQDPAQIAAGLGEQALLGAAGVALREGVSALAARFPILRKPIAQVVREGRTKAVLEPVSEPAPAALPNVAGGSQGVDAAVLESLAPAPSSAAAARSSGSKALVRRDLETLAPDRGFAGGFTTKETLRPGAVIDRFGGRGGHFTSPEGTPFSARGLPPENARLPYERFEVLKPFEVDAGIAGHAFGGGGGIQYELPASVQQLIDAGVLRPVK